MLSSAEMRQGVRQYGSAFEARRNRFGRGDVVSRMQEVLKMSDETVLTHREDIARTAQVLMAGGLALIPTETVYGLGVATAPLMAACNSLEPSSEPRVNGVPVPSPESGYRRIFSVKRRELAQTVPWLVGGVAALDEFGREVDPITRALAKSFWPGALTLIVRAQEVIPAYLQAPDGTIALRCSASPVVAALIESCQSPLATTSANTHGAPAPASFEAVEPAVFDGVDIAIDAGRTPCQDASTIVSCIDGEPVIIRVGALAPEEIYRVAEAARAETAATFAPLHRDREE